MRAATQIRLPHELGGQVDVADGGQEIRKLAYRLAPASLLQVGPVEPVGVVPILIVGPLEDLFPTPA